jgi:hypothetical protein
MSFGIGASVKIGRQIEVQTRFPHLYVQDLP